MAKSRELSLRFESLAHSLRIYPYPMVWPLPRLLDLISQTPLPRGRGRPLVADLRICTPFYAAPPYPQKEALHSPAPSAPQTSLLTGLGSCRPPLSPSKNPLRAYCSYLPPKTQTLDLTDPAFVVLRFESRNWRSLVEHSFHVELRNGLQELAAFAER